MLVPLVIIITILLIIVLLQLFCRLVVIKLEKLEGLSVLLSNVLASGQAVQIEDQVQHLLV